MQCDSSQWHNDSIRTSMHSSSFAKIPRDQLLYVTILFAVSIKENSRLLNAAHYITRGVQGDSD